MIEQQKCNNMQLAQQIANQLNIDAKLAQILISRNINTVQNAVDFLNPSLNNLTPLDRYFGLEEVADRIQLAIQEKQTVVIYGDYDCDGICATTILYLFLTSKGVNTFTFLPNRYDNGYGMNCECLEQIAEAYLPDLLITVDCGINSVEEVEYCQEVLGFDVIITDHHTPAPQLPQCSIFNPKLTERQDVFKDLCGGGIALRLVEKLAGLEESKKYYDIACLATVADVVPLLEDNRIITYYGLKLINSGYRLGLALLSGQNDKVSEITSSDIAFRIAPKINALGRLGDANKVLGVFIEKDRFLLDCLIAEINKTNEKRQTLTNDLYEYCKEQLQGYDFDNNPLIILYNPYWEEGVLGITASKIVGDFNRPTILLTKAKEGGVKGSGRSIDGINIYDLVKYGEKFLDKFGGHKSACGLSLQEENVKPFSDCINNYAKAMLSDELYEKNFLYSFELNDIDNISDFSRQLAAFQPFGEGNPQPLFSYKCNNDCFELINNTKHIKSKKGDFEFIGWGLGDCLKAINCNCKKTFLCRLDNNIFKNHITTQATIVKLFIESAEQTESVDEYIAQSNFDDESIFKPISINLDDISKIVGDKKYGTCFIAYSKITYDNAVNFFEKSNIKVKLEYMHLSKTLPTNIMILNPTATQDFRNFEKIVFLDRPMNLGYVDMLNLYRKAQVYYIDNIQILAKCKEYLPSYSRLGEIFLNVKNLTTKKTYSSLYLLYIDLSKCLEIDYNSFVISMNIFLELKIFCWKNSVLLFNQKVTNKIDNSKLYKLLNN